MRFSDLRHGTFVRYNDMLLTELADFPQGEEWQLEPMDCFFQVERATGSYVVGLECVDGCGQHLCTDLTRAEFDKYNKRLGRDFLVTADFNEVTQPRHRESFGINMSEEVQAMLQWITENS